MKVLLVGHSLPRGYAPGTPAFPDNSARWYRKMMEVDDIHDWMDTINLVDRDGMTTLVSPREEQEGISRVLRHIIETRPAKLLLAGPGVSKPMGLERSYFEWGRASFNKHELQFCQVPHPSGLNRWWNLPLNRSEASLFFRSLKEAIIDDLGKPAVQGPAWT